MAFRIGINLGDVIIDPDDIHGDGVNVAVRLQHFSEPGGISVSEDAFRQVRGKIAAKFVDLGEQNLKNIARSIRVYRVGLAEAAEAGRLSSAAIASAGAARPPLALPDRPSIAVLPFQNMSDDPEQEYFADGMVEEITTALSRMRWLFVIARNSAFTYKGRAVDVKQVARELGVRYVLEGSVRRAAHRVRIAGQLIDGSTGAHLWADRFEGDLEDVFDLQDRVTASVVGAIAPMLEQAEIERAKRKPTESLDAYDYYLRGLASLYQWTEESANEALRMFYKAVDLDANFESAHGVAAWCYFWRMANGWTTDRTHEIAETTRLAGRVAKSGTDDPVALAFSGLALGLVVGELKAGAALVNRALVLDPNLAAAWYASGFFRAILGDHDLAIEHIARAARLSPLDPLMFYMHHLIALTHFLAGRYNEAWPLAERSSWERPNFLATLRVAAASNVLAGRLDEARGYIARTLQLDPEVRISNLKDRMGPLRPEDFAIYVEALRLAGLPE
ncbi:MAG TPA: adenylate/guanylate cyclase domain-containing protein [Alphaproteobacteria bacterium]|nr:adenylate/guanylate cyclase domain-containing protein [Alphaproteobacteria bacterium]